MGSAVPRWGLFLPTFNFQVQAQLAVRHAVTVSLHAVKLLYTSTFQWGLNVATHCCVEVHQCFIRDQPNTTEISQIQLAPAVTWHGGWLGCYWGPIACTSLVGRTGCSVHSEFAEMQIPMIKKILYPFSLFPYHSHSFYTQRPRGCTNSLGPKYSWLVYWTAPAWSTVAHVSSSNFSIMCGLSMCK